MSGILAIWESRTNEDSEFFTAGCNRYHYKRKDNWKIGKIVLLEGGWHHESEGRRLEVYDTDDNLRVTLPMNACAVEYEP